MAILLPMLVLLMIGILEFGGAFKDFLTTSSAVREGTRALSALGDDEFADCVALAKALEVMTTSADFDKIETIAIRIYGAAGVELLPAAAKALRQYEELGFGHLPICMAKTQYSLSHDGGLKNRPTGFRVPIREVRLSAGAGFVTPILGEMRTMPGLPSRPGGENIDLDADGEILGLF